MCHRYADALHILRDVRDPRLVGARRAVKDMVLMTSMRVELEHRGWTPAAWLRPFDPIRQDAITYSLFVGRAGWMHDDYRQLEHDPIARRDTIELAHRVGQPLAVMLSVGQ